MSKIKTKTFWPYGILLSILAIIVACVATIIFASKYPVYEDEYYFTKYQDVKDNYSQIEDKQNEFYKHFSMRLDDENLNKITINKKTKKQAYEISPNETLKLTLTQQDQGEFKLNDVQVSALLTRPHTNKEDKNLVYEKIEDIVIGNPPLSSRAFYFDLNKLNKGRYQLKIKADNGKLASFQIYDLVVK